MLVNIKKFFIVLSAALLMVSAAGCAVPGLKKDPKVFSKAGMSITLDNGFIESEQVSYAACYQSAAIVVFVTKEEYELFEGTDYGPESTLKEYAELLSEANGTEYVLTEDDGLAWFSFEKESNGKQMKYAVYLYKSSDAFWMFQFATVADDFEKHSPRITEFAKSVTFEQKA